MSAGKEKMRQQAHMGSDVAKAIVSEPVQKIVTTMTHRHRETPPSAIPKWLTPDSVGRGSARCLRLLSRLEAHAGRETQASCQLFHFRRGCFLTLGNSCIDGLKEKLLEKF